MNGLFRDRAEAGRRLSALLTRYARRPDGLVLALPRGGVPVAYEVARGLGLPMDVFLVRKLGVPGHEEFAMGAVASGGVRVLSEDVIEDLGISPADVATVEAQERRLLEERTRLYRGDRPEPPVNGRTVILVDDGLATGSTMKAAIAALASRDPARVIVAVPVAPVDTREVLSHLVDEVACVATPEPFIAVGRWYASFPQTSDSEVRDLLLRSRTESEVPVTASA